MQFLFDSDGKNVANEQMGHLYSPAGRNIGHYLNTHGIFIDQKGRYLGQIVLGNRLMADPHSPYQATKFAVPGDYGTCGNLGKPDPARDVAPVNGYEDISARRAGLVRSRRRGDVGVGRLPALARRHMGRRRGTGTVGQRRAPALGPCRAWRSFDSPRGPTSCRRRRAPGRGRLGNGRAPGRSDVPDLLRLRRLGHQRADLAGRRGDLFRLRRVGRPCGLGLDGRGSGRLLAGRRGHLRRRVLRRRLGPLLSSGSSPSRAFSRVDKEALHYANDGAGSPDELARHTHEIGIHGRRPHSVGGDRLRRVRAVRAPAVHPGARRQARRHGRHPPARGAGRGRPVRGRERRRRRRPPPAGRRGRGLHRHPAVPPPPAGDGRPGGRQARDRREAAGPDRRARPTS